MAGNRQNATKKRSILFASTGNTTGKTESREHFYNKYWYFIAIIKKSPN